MSSVSEDYGRTVIFVSHNMESIKKLCTKVIILNQGKVIDYGETQLMVNKYLNIRKDIRKFYKTVTWSKDKYGPGSEIVKLKSIK